MKTFRVRKKKRLRFRLLAAVLCLAIEASARTAAPSSSRGNVRLSGEIPVSLNLQVIDLNDGIDFQNLGKTRFQQQRVGQINIDSNSVEGFRLRLNSRQNGHLALFGDLTGQKKIPYTLSLERRGGVLGIGTVGPLAISEIDLRGETDLDFIGHNAEPTRQLTYDVNLSLGEKTLPPGIYKDTIVFQLIAL